VTRPNVEVTTKITAATGKNPRATDEQSWVNPATPRAAPEPTKSVRRAVPILGFMIFFYLLPTSELRDSTPGTNHLIP